MVSTAPHFLLARSQYSCRVLHLCAFAPNPAGPVVHPIPADHVLSTASLALPCPRPGPRPRPCPCSVSAPAPVVNGIPPGLAALLRHMGPWEANQLYSYVFHLANATYKSNPG
ncbi:hypothetical protein B0H13DRAFT_2382339 [Mycena leptocephala]|nr:hypothetical protein B0H13DRAFT_2382339 [Mycena leptocephala]